jgi:hypothetical protein
VMSLLVEHIVEIRCEAGLGQSHVKAVRKPMTQEPVEGPHPFRPVIAEGETVTAIHCELGPARVRRPYLESRGEDQAVHFILHLFHHHPALGYPLDTLTASID